MAKKLKYPTVLTREAEKDIKSGKGKLKEMSPKAFLAAARALEVGAGDRRLIDNFKDVIKDSGALGPLKLYKDGKEDGRHRATASKELELDKVPVIDYRKNGGHVLEDDHPTHYLPNVGRQVMAEGGVPSLDQIRQMMIGTAPPPSTPSPGAYTDPYGLKVAAPFVEAMRGGYPTPPSSPTTEANKEDKPHSWLDDFRERFKFADGGEVEGDVSFLEEDQHQQTLPTFAQPETQVITKALDVANAAQPREAEMRAYEPTIRERIYGAVAGTGEARPTAERASFAKNVADILGYTPVLGQAMAAQEAARSGDSKGVAMAILPMPAGRAGAAAEGAATNIARRVTNPLGMHSEAAEVARALPQQKGTIEQMLAMMKQKVNPEELYWSEVSKAFQPGQKVGSGKRRI